MGGAEWRRLDCFMAATPALPSRLPNQIKEPLDNIEPGLVELFNISQATPPTIAQWDCLIFGIPTVNIGQLQDDWDVFWPHLDEIDFTGKKVAIFGLGDQYNYSTTPLDAAGILATKSAGENWWARGRRPATSSKRRWCLMETTSCALPSMKKANRT